MLLNLLHNGDFINNVILVKTREKNSKYIAIYIAISNKLNCLAESFDWWSVFKYNTGLYWIYYDMALFMGPLKLLFQALSSRQTN